MSQFPKQSFLSRSHMLRMAMLSQRAVDYSINAYIQNCPGLCGQVSSVKRELFELQLSIRDRGRSLVAAGAPLGSDSAPICSSLRIYSALRVMFTAATELTQNIMVVATENRKTDFPQTIEAGIFINGLVRLCFAALCEEQISLARAVLQIEGGRRRFDLSLERARLDVHRRSDTHCKCEIAIVNCIGHIAEQAYEIGEDIIALLEGNGHGDFPAVRRERALDATATYGNQPGTCARTLQ